MFLSSFGGPISLGSVLHMLHRVLKRAGLPRVRFHDLRHTFATLALQNGVDIKTVSGMLGHFSAGFTLDTYAHVTTAAQKAGDGRPWSGPCQTCGPDGEKCALARLFRAKAFPLFGENVGRLQCRR